jgi:SAM-dependent methyltransferase
MSHSESEFDVYFDRRASRFAAFYRSEPVSRLLGRGPLFDRLTKSVEALSGRGVRHVLDVGCGSGPLFGPLASRGIEVTGLDPAPAMVALARRAAAGHPDLLHVQERGWEAIDEVDAFDAAVALGVYDYVDEPDALLARMGRAAPLVVGSFPAPGLRTELRKLRYGARHVHVHGYRRDDLDALAARNAMRVAEAQPLGRAGFLVIFERIDGLPADPGTTPTGR